LWPNVTISGFSQQAREALTIVGGRVLSFNPVISQANRLGWEAYAADHAGLLGDESLLIPDPGADRMATQSNSIVWDLFKKYWE